MNSSDRITYLLQYYNIKAGDFAENVNVAPATISNIKNGKTNFTATIAQKIVAAYPELNFQWVLLGQGDMVQSAGSKVDSDRIVTSKPFETELFPEDSTSDGEIIKSQPVSNQMQNVVSHQPLSSYSSSNTSLSTNKSDDKPKIQGQRSIEKIIIYYNDKTFEEYDLTKCKL